jgi:hypothetical protein
MRNLSKSCQNICPNFVTLGRNPVKKRKKKIGGSKTRYDFAAPGKNEPYFKMAFVAVLGANRAI